MKCVGARPLGAALFLVLSPGALTFGCSDDSSGSGGGSSGTSNATEASAETAGASASTAAESSSGGDVDVSFDECFEGVFVNDPPLADYDGEGVKTGSHCLGSDHQTIENVQRVVFLGDSVAVGTPPTPPAEYYRNRLADMLADRFGLEFGSNKTSWQNVNLFQGQSSAIDSGAFSACAEWGARNDDLLTQTEQCFTDEQRQLTTLTIITSGGNDLSNLAQDAGAGVELGELLLTAGEAVGHIRESVEWLTDPVNFPNGNYVVFSNIYEFTDATGEVQACDFAGLAGFDMPLPVPEQSLAMLTWLETEYAKLAVDTGSDFIFLFEEFCGHGYAFDNPDGPCYRGPGNELWFDVTCIHPNSTGHAVLADLYLAVISE